MEKKNWIQKAVNKEHKGYCTPMTKSTCTPKRKALAQTFKSMAKSKKHENGGSVDFLMPLIEGYKKGGKVENTFGKDKPFPTPLKDKKGGKLSKEYIKKAHEKPGGSNVGKKKFANGEKRTGPYAGPSGGAPKGSYPIPDVKHAKSAIKLSGHAPNPEGIKKEVYKKYPQLKKHDKGGMINNKATADSTKYYQKQVVDNIANHFKANNAEKEETAKKVSQSKAALSRQENKGKPGYDKNGFPIITSSKQKGGELESVGDQAAAYKKGSKVKQMGGQIYGAAKKGTKIDASKWKKSK